MMNLRQQPDWVPVAGSCGMGLAGPFAGARRSTVFAHRRAFSLIEIMIVISIVAIVISAGVPMMFRAMQKNELLKAVSDIVEGCSHARARAILQGVPTEFVIRAEDGNLSIQTAAVRRRQAFESQDSTLIPKEATEKPTAALAFSSQLGEDVIVRFLDVNFKDHMELPEARVRFYPNGTSDEFAIVIETQDGQRKIALEVVTGLADVQVLR